MKNLILLTLIASMFFACHKEAGDNSINNKLVRSISSTYHKLDSSGRLYTTVDSFVFDNQKKIAKIIISTYDTIFNTNIPQPKIDTQTVFISYAGNNPRPTRIYSYKFSKTLSYDNSGRLVKDSISPGNVTNYSYSTGLIVGFSGSLNSFYTIDSISIDVNNNVVFQLLGGNAFLNSTNNFIYGKMTSWQYSYSNILNPVYTNTSLSTVLFLLTNNIQSKNIASDGEWIIYGNNGPIFRDEKSHYQINVDLNNNVQNTIDLINGDMTKWAYY